MGSSPATSQSTLELCGRVRTERRACWSKWRPARASKIFAARLPSTLCRRPISPPRHCSKVCRPGRTCSIAFASRIIRFRARSVRRRSGIFARRRANGAPSRSSGRAAGGGFGIDEGRGGMRTYSSMLKSRPDFFIHCGDHIYADCPLRAEHKLPNGEVWRNIVTEEKSKIAQTLADFRGNYKYNLLDKNVLA